MKHIKHIFFDLDHTLWDYETSAAETLQEIYQDLKLETFGVTLKKLVKCFYDINAGLWARFNAGEIDRSYIQSSRFESIFETLGVDISLSERASEYFISVCSTKPYLMPDAEVALSYLKDKYALHIITNGFTDVQQVKLTSGGIRSYFDVIVTSENANARKPSPEIFEYALNKSQATVTNCIMIGDNPSTDIKGASNLGIKTVFYDPSGLRRTIADFTIQSHLELLKLF